MNARLFLLPLLGGMLVLLIGCGQKGDVKSEVANLEKAFPEATSAAPISSESSSVAEPVNVNNYVNLAASAIRTNDYASAVILLQQVQTKPGVSARQLMTLAETVQKVTAELVARASKGDPKAKADLAAIERASSQ